MTNVNGIFKIPYCIEFPHSRINLLIGKFFTHQDTATSAICMMQPQICGNNVKDSNGNRPNIKQEFWLTMLINDNNGLHYKTDSLPNERPMLMLIIGW